MGGNFGQNKRYLCFTVADFEVGLRSAHSADISQLYLLEKLGSSPCALAIRPATEACIIIFEYRPRVSRSFSVGFII